MNILFEVATITRDILLSSVWFSHVFSPLVNKKIPSPKEYNHEYEQLKWNSAKISLE